jgi:hypothetical protein
MAIRVPFLLRKVEYWQWMGSGWAGSAANIRHSSAISLSGLPTLGFSQHPCRGGAMQGPLRLPQLKIPQQCWEPVRGTPGESSPSARGCGDDHGHPSSLPGGMGAPLPGDFASDRIIPENLCVGRRARHLLSHGIVSQVKEGVGAFGRRRVGHGVEPPCRRALHLTLGPSVPLPELFFSSKGGHHLRASSGVLLMPSLPDDGMTVGRHQNSNHGNQSPI